MRVPEIEKIPWEITGEALNSIGALIALRCIYALPCPGPHRLKDGDIMGLYKFYENPLVPLAPD